MILSAINERQQAENLLQSMLGPGAQFRPGQWEAIAAALRRERLLVVQRTGWGKSIVYFLATRLLRDGGAGPTVVISPLLSLMRNQLEAARRIGIHAATIHSDNRDEWAKVEAALTADACDLLLISPERLNNDRFEQVLLPAIQGRVGLFVVDEAHCVSDWGHDFRPDYRRIARVIRGLPANVPVLATTATANDRVIADVREQLGFTVQVLRGPLARESLRLQSVELADPVERLAWLGEVLPSLPGTGIIYCLTVRDCRRVSAWLTKLGIEAPAYYAERGDAREELEQRLLRNEVKALVATVALGMGFDKPDLGFVVHYQRPGSAIAYYQQVGRAGRALEEASVVLLSGEEDDEITDYFIRSAFADPDEMLEVVRALERSESLSVGEILAEVNLSLFRLEKALRYLEVEGIVAREASRYYRTANPLRLDTARAERVTALRRHELQRMRDYVRHPGCLMEFLARELDDPHARPCGRCANCAEEFLPRRASAALLTRAREYLAHEYPVIEPRRMWPSGGIKKQVGRIDAALVAEPGRALCIYDDPGWGKMVPRGKYSTGRFPDDLVDAAVELITRYWRPNPAPEWVTCIPSERHPGLVPDFARRLAKRLNLRFVESLVHTQPTSEQKTMQNSTMQARNVAGSLRAKDGIPPGPVLLVDDLVDSRWTMTVAAFVLRKKGAGPVYPFALAVSTGKQ